MTRAKPVLDPIPLLHAVDAATPRKYAFTAKNSKQALAWQKKARPALADCLGFLDQKKVDLEPRTVQVVDRGDYIRKKVILRTTPWSLMPVYVLIPKQVKGKLPCVLALHGHGYGVKDAVGLWEDGSERWTVEGYHRDFACELAKRGFLVIAPEISCFGERRSSWKHLFSYQPVPTTCQNVATYAIMLGVSAFGIRVWDGMRALDYLETLKIADASRIGAMGISGGGTHTFFSTALDPRIKACVISGYFCDWRDSILTIDGCTCNYVPGLLKLGDITDFAGLIAPRQIGRASCRVRV